MTREMRLPRNETCCQSASLVPYHFFYQTQFTVWSLCFEFSQLSLYHITSRDLSHIGMILWLFYICTLNLSNRDSKCISRTGNKAPQYLIEYRAHDI